MLSPQRLAALGAIGFFVLSATAFAQQNEGDSPPVVEIPYFDRVSSFRVESVDANGTVRLAFKPIYLRDRFAVSEGYYILVIRNEAGLSAPIILRARVDAVNRGSAVIVTVGPKGAAAIKKGDRGYLARPFESTTAQIRSLPDVIPLGPRPDRAPDSVTDTIARSVRNLHNISDGIHEFHAATKQLPPAIIYGPDRRPWHSWRVLILPFMEMDELYAQYDFSQPWDSPKNSTLLDKMPDCYHDPVYGEAKGRYTNYAVLVGAWDGKFQQYRTAFPPSGMVMTDAKRDPIDQVDDNLFTMEDVTDGIEKTIAVAPVSPDRKIPWTKPEDITVGANFPGLGQSGGIAAPFRGLDQAGAAKAAPVLMVDGTVLIIPDTININLLRALTTANTGVASGQLEEIDLNSVPTLPLPGDPSAAPRRVRLRIQVDGAKSRAWAE